MPLRAYIKSHHPKVFSTLKNLRSFFYTIMGKTSLGDNQDGSYGADTNPPFDPSLPAVPISYPLQELEVLESRAYFKSFHYPFNKAAVNLPSGGGGAELPRRPRILVCHDMAGGYADDRFVQGGTNPDAYAIWHWYLIDVFVYFSHSLVTLPPPCWTNAAHRHGVKVLGTFIMEWDEGKKRADKLLSSEESAQMYALRLTELAVGLGFDGWLINMEVKLDPEQIPNLKAFVSHLSQTMHTSVPGSLVIWYDSVTVSGDLKWQDQLNDKNMPFFDLCDGIFVNYTWKEDFPKLSAGVAGDRKFDVYVGIDVFGRGTYGGGQWTTNVALDVIKKADVSAAIFAPGWVYETKQLPDFQTAQNKWWGLVEESWGTVQKYPKVLPFYSNFDQGHGFHIYSNGKQVSDTPWNNISSQSFQPFLEYSADSTTQPIQVSINFREASYNGGGNIRFTGTLGDGAKFTARLFKGELLLGASPIYVTFSVKSNASSALGLSFEFSSATQEKKSILLTAPGNTLPAKLEEEARWVVQESRISQPGHILKEIWAVCYKSEPEKSIGTSEYYAVLGDIKITTTKENSSFPPCNSWLVDGEFVSWSSDSQGSKHLSVKIVWQLRFGDADLFPKYNVYVEKITGSLSANESRVLESANEYVGVTSVKSFYISELEVPCGTSGVKFLIQVCALDGTSQKLEDSPFLLLQVEGS